MQQFLVLWQKVLFLLQHIIKYKATIRIKVTIRLYGSNAVGFSWKTCVDINKPYTNKETYRKRQQRLWRDFEAQRRKICTEAKPPHVPEVYLTVTREILRVSARKIPQARVYLAHANGER